MALPLAAIGAGMGAAGSATGMIGQLKDLFGGGGPAYEQSMPGGKRVHDVLERGFGYGNLPYTTGKALEQAWRFGQLPLPMQQSLQAILPLTQMMYSGTMDQAAMGANQAREDVARRYSERGVTGPQMTTDLQRIDDMMRQLDLQGRRAATTDYQNALSGMWNELTSRGWSEPLAWFGLGGGGGGGGGGVAPGLMGVGSALQQFGRNMTDLTHLMSPTGNVGSGGLSFNLPSTQLPSVGQDFKWSNGQYNIPGINMP